MYFFNKYAQHFAAKQLIFAIWLWLSLPFIVGCGIFVLYNHDTENETYAQCNAWIAMSFFEV